ncbi:tyrosine-type recombinase/integrase [Aureimonas ureilytica]|uniref:tyrosine-type recombinase/integrase n=1 Tax=Aureimonas ureilytica TaxID=401562 RepID=UPI0009DB7D07|nr:site-specific integrase [Aureimonas ureilytica]
MPDLPTTKGAIEALPLPVKNAADYRDTKQRALYLRVSPAGTKSWCVRDDRGGKSKRLNIGRFPDIPISLARERAAKMLTELAGGADPKAEKAARAIAETKRRANTVAAIGETYLEKAEIGRHRLNGKPMRPNSLRQERAYFESVVRLYLGNRPLADLTRAEIQIAIDKAEADKSKAAARFGRNVLQRIYNYAIWQDIVSNDPTRFVSAPTWTERERVLTDAELRALWQGLSSVATIDGVSISPNLVTAIKLAAVTLQRRSEVIGMRIDEINREARTWTLPGSRTKNGRTHVVPLSDLALELIDEAVGFRVGKARESQFVFTARRNPEAAIGAMALTHAWRRLLPHLTIPDPTEKEPARTKPLAGITPHDLRRTGATAITSERIGMPRFVVSQVLNHSSDAGGTAAVTAVYDRNAYMREKRAALDAWADLLLSIVKDEGLAA